MARDVHIPLPADADPKSADFLALLEDRLRRMSDAIRGLQEQINAIKRLLP